MNSTQIVAKWTPLLVGLEEAKTSRCAWAFEQEAIYLKSLSESQRDQLGGASFKPLRFVFPMIRRAMDFLDESTTDYAHVHAAVSRAVQECAETANEIDPTDFVPVEAQAKLSADLADRLHTALLTVPD